MDLRSRLLKESNRSKFDSNSVRNGVLIISHITFRDNCVFENSWPLCPSQKKLRTAQTLLWLSGLDRVDPVGPSSRANFLYLM